MYVLCVWRSQDNSVESVLSSHLTVGSGVSSPRFQACSASADEPSHWPLLHVFINKVLLEHNHVPSFLYCPCGFGAVMAELSRDHETCKPKVFPTCFFKAWWSFSKWQILRTKATLHMFLALQNPRNASETPMVKRALALRTQLGGVMGKKQVDEKMPGTVLRQPEKQKAQSLSRGGFHLIRKETDRPLGSQLSGQT